jgi:DNA-binding transcriptional regulator YhcF (GntR family)
MIHRFSGPAQLVRHDRELERSAVMRDRVAANLDRINNETGLESYRRLRRYEVRQGYREIRFALTQKRGKAQARKVPKANGLEFKLVEYFMGRTRRSGSVCQSLRWLAAEVGYSRRQVIRALKELERKAIVVRDRSPGSPTAYRLNLQSAAYDEALEYAVMVRFERLQALRRSLEHRQTIAEAA